MLSTIQLEMIIYMNPLVVVHFLLNATYNLDFLKFPEIFIPLGERISQRLYELGQPKFYIVFKTP